MNKITTVLLILLFTIVQVTAAERINQPDTTFEGPSEDVETLAFTPDSTRLYVGGWDDHVYIYEWPSGKLLEDFRAHHSAILNIRFSKDGAYMMTSSNDNTARLWRTEDHELMHTFSDHNRPVRDAGIAPDNRFVYTISEDGRMYVYDREDDFGQVTHVDLEGEEGNALTFEPARGMIVKGTSGNIATMVQPGNFNVLREFQHEGGVNDIYFLPDGSRVITGSSDQTAVVWDPVEGERVATLEGHSWRVLSVHMEKEGKYAVTSSNDGTARLWDVQTGQTLRIYEPEPRTVIRSAVLSPDLKYVITSGQMRQPGQAGIMLWDSGLIKPESEEEEETEEAEVIEGEQSDEPGEREANELDDQHDIPEE